MKPIVISINVDKSEWISSNSRMVWQEKARRTKWLVNHGLVLARAQKVDVPTPSKLAVVVHMPTDRRFDPPNAWPTVKPIIDGFVSARALPDDSHREIPETSFERGDKTGVPGQYKLDFIFTPITGEGH